MPPAAVFLTRRRALYALLTGITEALRAVQAAEPMTAPGEGARGNRNWFDRVPDLFRFRVSGFQSSGFQFSGSGGGEAKVRVRPVPSVMVTVASGAMTSGPPRAVKISSST